MLLHCSVCKQPTYFPDSRVERSKEILANDNSILSEWDGKSTKTLRTEYMEQVSPLSFVFIRQLKEEIDGKDRTGQNGTKHCLAP